MLSITLLHNQNIYHHIMNSYDMTFGNHKKDTVYISDMGKSQILVKCNQNKVSVIAKAPYICVTNYIPLNEIILLNQQNKTAIYVYESIGFSVETVKLPYNCNIKIGRNKKNNTSHFF